ncbi:unnamed protein product [Amoebophrya sp. A120]|nr:unnamed protein product [Amoebophrya sp. A120]|eukprot:GSA120T00004231001.1
MGTEKLKGRHEVEGAEHEEMVGVQQDDDLDDAAQADASKRQNGGEKKQEPAKAAIKADAGGTGFFLDLSATDLEENFDLKESSSKAMVKEIAAALRESKKKASSKVAASAVKETNANHAKRKPSLDLELDIPGLESDDEENKQAKTVSLQVGASGADFDVIDSGKNASSSSTMSVDLTNHTNLSHPTPTSSSKTSVRSTATASSAPSDKPKSISSGGAVPSSSSALEPRSNLPTSSAFHSKKRGRSPAEGTQQPVSASAGNDAKDSEPDRLQKLSLFEKSTRQRMHVRAYFDYETDPVKTPKKEGKHREPATFFWFMFDHPLKDTLLCRGTVKKDLLSPSTLERISQGQAVDLQVVPWIDETRKKASSIKLASRYAKNDTYRLREIGSAKS